jgi:hypothetical protein
LNIHQRSLFGFIFANGTYNRSAAAFQVPDIVGGEGFDVDLGQMSYHPDICCFPAAESIPGQPVVVH